MELTLFMSRIADSEIQDIRRGTAEFAWVDGEHTALLCYRFGGAERSWSDSPYHPGRGPEAGMPPALARARGTCWSM
ncbi:hypothetical protein [Micromonospora chersina]|uniref:hypothetical protein n=1 Tax=Micromonospora chersina TaxID=47854 RepID=UPI00371EB5EE